MHPGPLQVFMAGVLALSVCPASSQLLGLVSGPDASLSFLFAFWMSLVSTIKKGAP